MAKTDMVSRVAALARFNLLPSLRNPGAFDSIGQVRWKLRACAWLIVAALVALAMVGFPAFHGASEVAASGRVVNPMHDGRCPASGIEAMQTCPAGNASADPEDAASPY